MTEFTGFRSLGRIKMIGVSPGREEDEIQTLALIMITEGVPITLTIEPQDLNLSLREANELDKNIVVEISR